jgi:hypothetical protein
MLPVAPYRPPKVLSMIFYSLRRLRANPAEQQSTAMALGLAVAVALGGAVVWGLIEYLIHYQLSLLGIAIGAGIGFSVAKHRPGYWPVIIAGAVLAVLSCALGTFLAVVFEFMNLGASLSSILGHLNIVFSAYPHAINGFDVFFWALAAFAAIRIPIQSHVMNRRAAAGGFPPPAAPSPYGTPPQPYGTPPQQPYNTPPQQPYGPGPQPYIEGPAFGAGPQPYGTSQPPPEPPQS